MGRDRISGYLKCPYQRNLHRMRARTDEISTRQADSLNFGFSGKEGRVSGRLGARVYLQDFTEILAKLRDI